MSDLMGKTWNYFTAMGAGGQVTLFPGAGNHTWSQVREYLSVRIADSLGKVPVLRRKEVEACWAKEEVTSPVRYTVTALNDGTRRLFVAYEYEETGDYREEALRAYEHLPVEVIENIGYGIDVLSEVKVASADMERMGEETIGRIEMRVGFLFEEAGFPRMSPPMYPTGERSPLELYRAIEENWKAVASIALSPTSNDDISAEARYLTYSICLLRFDLYAKSKEMGVEPAADPAISWSSRTRSSKSW